MNMRRHRKGRAVLALVGVLALVVSMMQPAAASPGNAEVERIRSQGFVSQQTALVDICLALGNINLLDPIALDAAILLLGLDVTAEVRAQILSGACTTAQQPGDDGAGDGADATGTDATGTDATGTDATGTDATGTDATGTDATGTDATGTDATGTDATGADATGTDATGADSTGSDSTGADGSTGGNTATGGSSAVTGLPETGSGNSLGGYVWPIVAVGTVFALLAGQFVLGTVRNRDS